MPGKTYMVDDESAAYSPARPSHYYNLPIHARAVKVYFIRACVPKTILKKSLEPENVSPTRYHVAFCFITVTVTFE